MADLNAQTKEFQRLAGEAAEGRLMIEHTAAENCATHCDNYISDLRDLSLRTRSMVRADSFGDLKSAKALGAKFAKLAEDSEAGSGSYTEAIRQHIEVLTAMADMYRKAGAAYKNCDEATQLAIQQQTNNID
ncbi:hypothetical protein ACFVVM_24170 [Nocardia sp. NPDC058176]|uniref:hypothetical protein n=1 Tax=Nocardia sp. NPDC058176 TaxID=3346368 RepID=UPI0036DDD45A